MSNESTMRKNGVMGFDKNTFTLGIKVQSYTDQNVRIEEVLVQKVLRRKFGRNLSTLRVYKYTISKPIREKKKR